MGPVPVLIDTDPGIDDALALLLAFRAPEWQIEAVTTVAGNVPVAVGTRNVWRILGILRPARLPLVGIGAAGPRARPLVTAAHVHGKDGLGGLSTMRDPGGALLFPEGPIGRHAADAADLIVDCARRWPGELVILALGPLTNLAQALDRDGAALGCVRAVVAMGGAVAVGGNVTAAAEYNVFVDPESAARVLGARLPVTLVPRTSRGMWCGLGPPSRACDPRWTRPAGLRMPSPTRGSAWSRRWASPGSLLSEVW